MWQGNFECSLGLGEDELAGVVSKNELIVKKTRESGSFLFLVRKVGLEPTRPFERWNLNPVRLPISPLPRSSDSLTNSSCG